MKKSFFFLTFLLLAPLSARADLCKGVLLSETENCGFPHHAGEVLKGLHAGRSNKHHQPKTFEQQHVRCPWEAKKITLINCHIIPKDVFPYYDMILNDTADEKTPITYQTLYDLLVNDAGFSMDKAGTLARTYLRDPRDACSLKVGDYLNARKMGRHYPQRAWMAEPCSRMPSISVNNPQG